VSAGVPLDELTAELHKLHLTGFELQASHRERSGIVATKIDVVISEPPHGHRHLKDIHAVIDASGCSSFVKETAKRIFHEIAVAEATVHHSTPEKIHFHEVGAIDSIVDIVGTAICLEKLKVEAVYTSPIRTGSGGFVNTEHGKMPVPTPATVEILKGYPTELTNLPYELTTPTGAAIVKALSRGVLRSERVRVESIGYGAGSREIEHVPNLLRIMIGELEQELQSDDVVTIETNIDDMNPEVYPYVMEQLLNAGAHDVFLVPIIMKKGRPGMLISVLIERSKLDAALGILFRETSTLGVRLQTVERRKLPRATKQVNTSLGVVTVKSVIRDGHEQLVPEFEECKRLAKERGLPLLDVYKILEAEFSS
jgi:hypothetical protein